MATWRLAPLVCSWCLIAGACGGSSPTSPSSPSGGTNPGQVITLRGGERLAWDQPGDSPQAVRAYTFLLWVDNAAAQLVDTRCTDNRSAAGYECSGRLPSMAGGRHTLELSAVLNGRESGRSAPLSVMMGTGSLTQDTAASEAPPSDPQ